MEWLNSGTKSALFKEGKWRTWRHARPVFGAVATLCILLETAAAADAAGQRPATDLSRLSLEELADIEVSSVSKRPESINDAAAAIYVITREDIRRSGATSLPEILRLAPNLQVARVDASQYAITARGFNSTTANKLLVLVDGRSVYTPLFSGVFWDVPDVLFGDIERIEVISGPGGTLWGSNAVNGVINVITRKSGDTQGGVVRLGVGTQEHAASARYGTKLNEETTYRIYAKQFGHDSTETARGASLDDSWNKAQLGFRMDSGKAGDAFTFQGDVYDGSLDQLRNDDKSISGGNLLGRWNRKLAAGSAVQVQAYYDRSRRDHPGTFAERLDTYDIELQHRFAWRAGHDIVWGGGYRRYRDDVSGSPSLQFLPEHQDLSLSNVFVQDSIALSEHVQATLGVKLEDNSYTGVETQPNARLAWKLDEHKLLWSAISRAVRTPSRLDRDLFTSPTATSPFSFAGGPEFDSEKLTAYEIGYRAQPALHASFSVSTFYNVYDELRSIEPVAGSPGTFVFSNKMEGETYGVELWGNYRMSDRWRLSGGYNYLEKDLRFKSDSQDTFGIQAAGNDPVHQYVLRSALNLRHDLEFDAALRRVGALPNPTVPSYVELDMRLGWNVDKDIEIALTGSNLLDRQHPEFGQPATRGEAARRFFLRTIWKL